MGNHIENCLGVDDGLHPPVANAPDSPVPEAPADDPGDDGSSITVGSQDPNEKFGANGYGPQEFIAANSIIPYRINFENLGLGSVPKPAQPATAPAQRVEITDQLSDKLDWNTFSFTEFGFGDIVIDIPAGLKYAFHIVPMTYNDQNFDVQVELNFRFRHWDAASHLPVR